jgi:hypothetical protein
MAVVNVKSTLITNADAAQQALNNTRDDGGRLRSKVATNVISNTDSVGSTYRYFRVRSSDRVDELIMDSDDIGTTGAGDIGLYRTAADGGAVVDADFFASALVLNAGALSHQHVTRESAVIDHINKGKAIWQQLGLSADPGLYYDVVLTLTGAADGTGDVTLALKYVDGN